MTPPPTVTAPPTNPAPAENPSVSPLYQSFMDSAGQAGQLANDLQQPEQGSSDGSGGSVGLFGSGLASLVASAKATGPLIAATYDVLTGNNADAQVRLTNANKDLTTPVLGQKPLAAMNNEEALGVGAEAAGIGAGGLGAPVLGGALLGAGQGMQTNQGVGGVLRDTGIGAVGGKVLDMASPYLGKMAGSAYEALVPQAAKDALSSAGGAISSGLSKLVPDGATSDFLKTTVDKYAPTISKLFVSSVDNTAASTALASALGKTDTLYSSLGSEMGDLSEALSKQFPDAKITLNASQVQAIQAAATKAGISLPEFMNTASTASIAGEDVTAAVGEKIPSIDLNISQTQQLESSLNQAYEKGFVSSVKNEIRQTTVAALNNAQAGLGTVYDQMFQTASTGYNVLDTLNDTFNNASGKSLTATDISNRIAKVQSLLSNPQDKQIFSTILENVKTTSGLDLSSEANALDAAAKIKSPLAQRAAKTVVSILKKQGMFGVAGDAIAAYEVFKHL